MVANEYELKVLDYTAELCKFDLRNTAVLARQHLLSTTYDLFEKLFAKGLDANNVFLLGKCYSTNKEVYDCFIARGVYISPYSCTFDSHRPFDEQTQEGIEKLIESALPRLSDIEKMLILDDGGDLLLACKDINKNKYGVEQTSSGFRKLKSTTLQYPIVNVARSEAKLKLESPMIAEAVTRKLAPYLKKDSKILIVGKGPIGNSIYELLNKRYLVTCYDISDKNKFQLSQYDVIIGCTGETIIQPEQLKQCKKGAVLASASSSDIEFPALAMRKSIPRSRDCHQAISLNGITLLNGGFPINFDGSKHSVPPEKIQLTRSLLLVGINQALQSCENGLIALNTGMQNKIIEKYAAISSD